MAARIYDRSMVGPYRQMGLRHVAAYLTAARWRTRTAATLKRSATQCSL